jgi:hypothetical protein
VSHYSLHTYRKFPHTFPQAGKGDDTIPYCLPDILPGLRTTISVLLYSKIYIQVNFFYIRTGCNAAPSAISRRDRPISSPPAISLRGELHPSSFRAMFRYRLFVSFEDTNTGGFFFTGFEFEKEAVSMVLADIFKTALE